MNFRGGMNELMRQAARMQRKIEQTKEELKDKEISSESLGGKVKVVVTYGRKVKRIDLDPEFVKTEGLELALEGACVAISQAIESADKEMDAEITKLTGNVKIPGLT